MPRFTLLYRLTICSASRQAHADFGVGSPSFVQNPLSLSCLMSFGIGAFMIVSHPVERRLNIRPFWLVDHVTFASPPFPILSCVPRKRATSVLAWVMWVFSSLHVSRKVSPRKCLISCLISPAS